MAYQKIGYADSNGSWNVLKVNSDGSLGAFVTPSTIGSVYIKEDENEAAALWLSGLSNVVDYSITSNTTGSVIILARTL